MAVQSKPIPALYVVYILRSIARHASLYIGSTPNPPRRLNQHNGIAKGGASRTARNSLRPWEMVGVVSGFPSMVGALKFEWALNNPHLSLHIAPESRITVVTQRNRNGRPRRPPHEITSILSNLHLLLRVPSFARWPLNLQIFDREVFSKWNQCCAGPEIPPLRRSLEVLTDFPPASPLEAENEKKEAEARQSQAIATILKEGFVEQEEEEDDEDVAQNTALVEKEEEDDMMGAPDPGWGIHALPLDYAPLGSYVEKAQDITNFEREGECVVCHQHLEHDKGLYAICSNRGCDGVGHLDCWGRHLLHQEGKSDDEEKVLPIDGHCPKCRGVVKWVDMMKELTLRTRGQKEVILLSKRRKKKKAASAATSKGKGKAVEMMEAPVATQTRAGREVVDKGRARVARGLLLKEMALASSKVSRKGRASRARR